MKKHIIFVVLFLFCFQIWGQETLQWGAGPKYNVRLLIVPFDPIIYYNDATPDMAPKYQMTHDELMMFFRSELNRYLHAALNDSCYTIDLLTDNTKEARQDIDGLYANISYEMRAAMPNRPEDTEDEGFFKKMARTKEKEKASQNNQGELYGTRTQSGEIYGNRQSTKDLYFHIKFKDPEFLPNLSERRNVDMFLFINQFEIKGNYGDPYTSGNKDFARTFKVHFSIYDHLGELVHGSFASAQIPFDLNDKNKVVSNYYPEIVRQIIYNIEFAY